MSKRGLEICDGIDVRGVESRDSVLSVLAAPPPSDRLYLFKPGKIYVAGRSENWIPLTEYDQVRYTSDLLLLCRNIIC